MDYKLGNFAIKPELLKKAIESNILLYCAVLILFLKIAGILVFINFPQNIFFADITKIALENFVNQARQSMGLPILTESQKLNEAARMKAENMVQEQYFSHTSPKGVTPWQWFSKAGYNYKYAGENLAIGFYDSEEVFQAWLNSASHKANLLNYNYKEIGTAVLRGFGENKAIVVVQVFGSPSGSKNSSEQNVNQEENSLPQEENVLAQTTQTKNMPEIIIYNYNEWLQNIIYGVSLTLIGILLYAIFLNFNAVNLRGKFLFRSIIILILLSLSVLSNKEWIISIIPHQTLI